MTTPRLFVFNLYESHPEKIPEFDSPDVTREYAGIRGSFRMETTINISARNRAILTDCAAAMGIPRSWLVRSLIQKAMKQRAGHAAGFVPVRYQERHMAGVHSAMSVCVNERDYELLIDARKFVKESVSFIVAWAVEKYLIPKNKSGKGNAIKIYTDNYWLANYFLAFQETQSSLCWVVCWGKASRNSLLEIPGVPVSHLFKE